MTLRDIPDFPNYAVSDKGEVVNLSTDRTLARTYNHAGFAKVTLHQGGTKTDRQIATLVAEAYVSRPTPSFDTPIHLDNDRDNCQATNLMWRPRWFAIEFRKQFKFPRPGFTVPIMDVETGDIYEDPFEVCIKFGLLQQEVIRAYHTNRFVWPTNQRFVPAKLTP